MTHSTSGTETVSTGGTIAAFIIVTLAIVAGGWLLLSSRPEPVEITILPPEPTATPLPTATPEPVTVYVTGAVNQPETMHTLPPGSRVEDALAAAGGTLAGANLTGVNQAARLRDGDQVHVPFMQSAQSSDAAPDAANVQLPTPSGGEQIRINTATADELEALPGIGPAMAQRIIDYRTENGAFSSLQDLDEVSGIGPATLENLEPLLLFD
jgi:competence protein ComEA